MNNFSTSLSSESGMIKGTLGLLLAGVVIFSVVLYIFGHVIPPGWMGVRQITMGPGHGFSKRALTPGYHLVLPYYSTIHLVPKSLQVMNLHREGESGTQSGRSLEIPTADRAIVDVDVSILSRFYSEPGKDGDLAHGGPADLLQNIGISAERWENHIQRSVDDQLKRTLGSLETSEFYAPDKRDAQLALALAGTNEILAKDGIKVEAILLRRYTYQAERIDNAIFQKNLQVQEQHLNTAASNLAAAQAQVEQVTAQLDAEIETRLVEGENEARVLRSEGDLFENKRKAEADLLVAKARAEVDRLRSSALAQSTGANIYVAREMAPLLGSLRGGIVTDIDPYDVTKWVKLLGGTPKQ
ncbi:MAG: hypothetical protein J0M12_07020 [Deltaproteobacteria bacterium]|nr:hypothetical protein [Deltaproteobacteria bacterium]